MTGREGAEDDAFGYRERKNGTVEISYQGRPVTTLRGDAAAKFSRRIQALDGGGAQLLMARTTGNFKRGNERRA